MLTYRAILKFTFLTLRSFGAISMHQMTPFLGISFTIIICFKSLNIVIVFLKLTKIWNFDAILGHLLCLGQKQVTMETRNIKYDMIRRFLLIIC